MIDIREGRFKKGTEGGTRNSGRAVHVCVEQGVKGSGGGHPSTGVSRGQAKSDGGRNSIGGAKDDTWHVISWGVVI